MYSNLRDLRLTAKDGKGTITILGDQESFDAAMAFSGQLLEETDFHDEW
jgi:hypothetical protein